MIAQAGTNGADMFAEAKHDAEFFGLHTEEAGKAPDHQHREQCQADAEPAEITAGQKLLHAVLGAAEKIFKVRRPRASGRLRSGAPRPFRTRTPGASALILPRHSNSPSRAAGPVDPHPQRPRRLYRGRLG